VQPLTVKKAPVLAGICTYAFMKTSNVIVHILLTIYDRWRKGLESLLQRIDSVL
jgi:hypothetical protein